MRIDAQNPLLGPAMLAAMTAKDELFDAKTALAEQNAAPPPAAVAATGTLNPAPATSVAMLVTLAAVDQPADRRRRAIAQAERGLDQLERLRDELETGIASTERLRELAQWTRGFTEPDDPKMAELARELELRVRVELAKHDVII